MNVIVSGLIESDRPDWSELYRLYAEFYQVPMTSEILDTIWSWIFDDNNKFIAKIARNQNGEALGIMHCREMPSPLRGRLVGFVDNLYIKEEHRGKRVTDFFVDSLAQIAKDNGWPFVRWITAEDNYRARSVYDKISDKTHWVTYQLNIPK